MSNESSHDYEYSYSSDSSSIDLATQTAVPASSDVPATAVGMSRLAREADDIGDLLDSESENELDERVRSPRARDGGAVTQCRCSCTPARTQWQFISDKLKQYHGSMPLEKQFANIDLSMSPLLLRFKAPEIEAAYAEFAFTYYYNIAMGGLILTGLVNLATGVLNFDSAEVDYFQAINATCIGVVSFLTALLVVAFRFRAHPLPPRQRAMLCAAMICNAVLVMIGFCVELLVAPTLARPTSGLMWFFFIAATHKVVRFARWLPAFTLMAVLLAAFYGAIVPQSVYAAATIAHHWLDLLLGCGLAVTVSFIFERNARRRFLSAWGVVRQQHRHNHLLYNMIPSTVAKDLKKASFLDVGVTSRQLPQITVVFADIVNFNQATRSADGAGVAQLLGSILEVLDQLCERHEIYKVENVGSTFMAASGRGMPVEVSDARYGVAAANFAMDIRRKLPALSAMAGFELDVKIGMHTGPVVAGVVGVRKKVYHLFGDTVNTASRMCSTASAGCIQCSEATRDLLQSEGAAEHIEIKSAGKRDMKGKGSMETFTVTQRVHHLRVSAMGMQATELANAANEKTAVKAPRPTSDAASSSAPGAANSPDLERARSRRSRRSSTLPRDARLTPVPTLSSQCRKFTLTFIDPSDERTFLQLVHERRRGSLRLFALGMLVYMAVEGLVEELEPAVDRSAAMWLQLRLARWFVMPLAALAMLASSFIPLRLFARVGSAMLAFYLLLMGASWNAIDWVRLTLKDESPYMTYAVYQKLAFFLVVSHFFTLKWLHASVVLFVDICTWLVLINVNARLWPCDACSIEPWEVTGALFCLFCIYLVYSRDRMKRSAFLEVRATEAEMVECAEHMRELLPMRIVHALWDGKTIVSEMHPEASVLFSDIVGFTALSARMEPRRLVAMLHELYSSFDKLTDEFRCYKIDIIGDAYVCCAGLPERDADHLIHLLQFAVRMHAIVRRVGRRHRQPLRMRIGVHSGPVYAGVIGKKSFRYAIWGETAQTAQQLESQATPETVHIMASTLDALRKRERERGIRHSLFRIEREAVSSSGTEQTYRVIGLRRGAKRTARRHMPSSPVLLPHLRTIITPQRAALYSAAFGGIGSFKRTDSRGRAHSPHLSSRRRHHSDTEMQALEGSADGHGRHLSVHTSQHRRRASAHIVADIAGELSPRQRVHRHSIGPHSSHASTTRSSLASSGRHRHAGSLAHSQKRSTPTLLPYLADSDSEEAGSSSDDIEVPRMPAK